MIINPRKKKHTCVVVFRLIVLMGFHDLEEILEGLYLAWNCEAATVIKTKFLLDLFQQDFKNRVGKIASRNDKPPKLWTNINRQISFGDIMRRLRTLATILVRITT